MKHRVTTGRLIFESVSLIIFPSGMPGKNRFLRTLIVKSEVWFPELSVFARAAMDSSASSAAEAAAAASAQDILDIDPNSVSGAAAAGFDEFMKTITSHYNHVIKETAKAPQGAKESFLAFTSAVNFNEPWIQWLLGFHIFYFLIFIWTRRNIDIQTIQFLITCMLVYISERLNTLAHDNWQAFSLQDYFDKQGVFVGGFSFSSFAVCCNHICTRLYTLQRARTRTYMCLHSNTCMSVT